MEPQGSSNRSFGIVFTAVFAIIGLWPLLDGNQVRYWLLVVSGAIFLVALIRPSALALANRLWTKFGLLLHKVTNPIILGLIFYVVITPFALVTRAFGRDVLQLKPEHKRTTYWIERDPSGPDPQSIKNQF